MILKRLIAIAVLSLASVAGNTQAAAPDAASPWHDNAYTSVRLIAAQSGTGGPNADAQPLRFGLEFSMQDDWKIYWRSPGDAGYPPAADWRESSNIAGIEMAWPAPERFSILGLETLGYKHGVIFPLTVQPQEPGKPVTLEATIDYLTCSDICVPEQATVSLELPATEGGITRYAFDINKFATLVPKDGAAHGLTIERPAVTDGEHPALLVTARSASGLTFNHPDLFVEGPERLSFGKPDVTIENSGHQALFRIPIYAPKPEDIALVNTDVTLTLVDGGRTAEASLNVVAADGDMAGGSPSAEPENFGFTILVFAFLGGLILNLMPCVLPVLAIKLAAVVGKSGAPRAVIRRGFIATASGIVFAFLLLAAALSVLKVGGLAVGWGIQFQQPVFLAVMAVIVTLFACNLWGFWNIRLPGFVGNVGGLPKAEHETPMSGHFLTGMLATLLATPCSAPLLGTAVGFALARGPVEIFAIFTLVGIGLAALYLLVAVVPGLAAVLPKPGRWMVLLKQFLGLALAGTAVWLLSVIATGSGTVVAVITGLALVAVCAGLWLDRKPESTPFYRAGTTVAMVAAVLLPAFGPKFMTPATPAEQAGIWQPFDRAEIDDLVADGQIVFVDVTADWCLTCKVNERVVLGDERVSEALASRGFASFEADWTRRDEAIRAELARFGRAGVPLYLVYDPRHPDRPQVLSELLTVELFLDALRAIDT